MLFIDARKLAVMISRVQCELTDEVIARIAGTVAAWRGELLPLTLGEGRGRSGAFEPHAASPRSGSGLHAGARTASEGSVAAQYQDIPGYCRSVTLAEIAEHGHVLTPGRYVGAEAVEDNDADFATKMQALTEKLGEQMAKGAELDLVIRQKLGGLGYEF